MIAGQVAIACESGPSELAIVADRSATPAWVAADLLSQAERAEEAMEAKRQAITILEDLIANRGG